MTTPLPASASKSFVWRGIPTSVETNAPDTFARESKRRPVGYRASRAIDADTTWMFTDGSGSGWHGLVVLRPDCAPRLLAREILMPMRNVAAEMNGLLLALEHCEPNERVTVVSDYLWNIHYVLGWFDVKAPALVTQVRQARATIEAKTPAYFRYIHTRGHRRDGTDFGFWNEVADHLCAARVPFDGTVPEAVLRSHISSGLPLQSLLLATQHSA